MDTNDLSEMAYGIIVQAARVCETLKADLGSRSLGFENEDDWLRSVRIFLQKIIEEPVAYLEYWNLEEEEGVTSTILREIAAELFLRVEETLATSIKRRNRRR